MPDVLLIQPPIRDFYLTAKRTIPYGLACIAASLRNDGFSVRILDALATSKSRKFDLPAAMLYLREFYSAADLSPFSLFHEFKHFGISFERIAETAQKSRATLIGISSLFTAYSNEAIQTARVVKAACPEAVVVLGGHHPTEMSEAVLEHDCVDFIIRGEGELAFTLLARALRDGTRLDSVPGLGFRRQAVNSSSFSPRPHSLQSALPSLQPVLGLPALLENLDSLPPPAIDLIDNRFYGRRGKSSAVIVASRGCPLSCTYCSIGSSSWSRFRLKSVETVIDEMERAVFGGGARFIDFEDENLAWKRDWFLRLLTEIRKRFGECGLELRAMNGLFPPSLNEDLVRAMKEAGFTALNLSLCTTCRSQLKRFHRPDVRAEFEKVLTLAETYGLETVGYIIVGAPGQDPRDSVDDLLYLASKKVLAGVSVFYPAPGSADFEKCRTQNLLPAEFSLMRSTALPISDTTTRENAATLLRLGRVLNFLKSLNAEEKNEVVSLVQLVQHPGMASESGGNLETFNREDPLQRLQSLFSASQKENHEESARDHERTKRRMTGIVLLASFLRDGVIRGVTPGGKVFEHATSKSLCLPFRDGLLGQL